VLECEQVYIPIAIQNEQYIRILGIWFSH